MSIGTTNTTAATVAANGKPQKELITEIRKRALTHWEHNDVSVRFAFTPHSCGFYQNSTS